MGSPRSSVCREEWKPLELGGTLFELDTSDPVDIDLLAERISRGA
jgi:hypothetical protein